MKSIPLYFYAIGLAIIPLVVQVIVELIGAQYDQIACMITLSTLMIIYAIKEVSK